MSEGMAEAGDVDGSMLAMQQAEAFGKQHDALMKQFTVPERMMAGACSRIAPDRGMQQLTGLPSQHQSSCRSWPSRAAHGCGGPG